MDALLAKLDKPAMRDVQLDWPGVAEMYPARVPDLYAGEAVQVIARLDKLEDAVTVRGLRPQPWVRRVLVTPDMHRTHHSVVETERNSNYGFCLSVWDRWLGTYTPAPRGALDIGLTGWRDPAAVATLGGVLRMPFRSPTHEVPVHTQ